jgi:membrane protease YdiL (CAAX protease family)
VNSFDPISEPEASSPVEPAIPLQIILEQPPPPPFVIEPVNSEVDLLDVLFISLMAVGSFVFVGVIAAIVYAAAHHGQQLDPRQIATNVFFVLPTEFVSYVAILGFMAALVWIRHRTPLFQAIHWNMPNRKNALNALLIGVAVTFASEIGEFALNRWIPKSLPITEFFKDRPSALLLAAFAVLVAPFMEEMLFRGFLYPALARWTGPAVSVLITASAFTVIHGAQLGYSWAALMPIFIVGATLTVTRAVTKSVATCVLVHMTYNFLLMIQAFVATHGFRDLQGI